MTWFRVHNDVLDNPKLLMLAPSDRWYFMSILSLKSLGTLDGYEGDKLDRVICAKLRLTKGEWDECSRRLQDEGLIAPDYQPCGWADRQFQSDSSTDRVRRHREKKKREAEKGCETRRNANETKKKRESNKKETQKRGQGNSAETDGSVAETRAIAGFRIDTQGQKQHCNVNETFQERPCNEKVAPPDYRVQITDTDNPLPVPYGTAAGAASPVDNFTLPDLGLIYSNPDAESEIYNHGVTLLARAGVEFGQARNFLQMLINKHRAGPVLDALIVTLIEFPVEPRAYLQAVLAKQGAEIPKDWKPTGPCLAELAALGIPDDIHRDARDVFVIWFREQGIRHNNFPALFVRWCQRDWDRAEANKAVYLQRLRASAGFGEEFREPA